MSTSEGKEYKARQMDRASSSILKNRFERFVSLFNTRSLFVKGKYQSYCCRNDKKTFSKRNTYPDTYPVDDYSGGVGMGGVVVT